MKTTKENFDRKIMETFVYTKFSPFLKLFLASSNVSLCALKVRLTEYEEIEKWIFFTQKTFTVTLILIK